MSKRRLSTQQARRIRRTQERRAERARSRETTAGDDGLGPEENGLVLSHYGRGVEIEPLAEAAQDGPVFCHLRANIDGLVAGDRVIWQRGAPSGVVVAREDRLSALQRPDRRGRMRTLAANIGQMVLVIAPVPEPHANLIDRYLVAAEHADIPVTILLNKIDLLDQCGDAAIEEMTTQYRELGYRLLRASTRVRHGLDELVQALIGETSVFVGQSGVGKSSLISALLPQETLRIAPLSKGLAKGQHTTTAARLYHLPDGGRLIDSPGIREFALVHLEPADIAAGFVEMRPYLGRCQFRDCLHRDEPGCAVRDAVEHGKIRRQRHQSYCRILADNESSRPRA